MQHWTRGFLMATAALTAATGQEPSSGEVDGRFGDLVAQVEGLDDPVDAVFGEDGRLFVLEANPGRVRVFGAEGELLGEGPSDPWITGEELARETGSTIQFESGWLKVNYREPETSTDYLDPTSLDWTGGDDLFWRGAVAHVCAAGDERPVDQAGVDSAMRSIHWTRLRTPDDLYGVVEVPVVWPTDLALIGRDRLAIVDAGAHELLIVGADGEIDRRTGGFGHFPGQLSAPGGVDVHGERLYIADTQNHRIQVFDLAGELLYEWGKHALLPRQGRGHLHYPTDVAISRDGTRAVVLEPFEGRIQIFGPATGPAAQYRTDPATLGADPTGHFGPPIAARGRYAVTIEPETQEIHVHDLDTRSGAPVLVGRAGEYGAGPGRFRGLVDVAFSTDGSSVWALDQVDAELAEFALVRDAADEAPRFRRDRLEFVRSFDLRALDEHVVGPSLIVVEDERVDVFDLMGGGVLSVGPDPAQRVWTDATDFADGSHWALGEPADLITGGEGGLLAAFERGSVALLDPKAARRPGAFGGLALDAEGGLWWTDRERHRVVGPKGPIGSGAGSVGPGLGRLEFTDPRGIALTGDGRVVVVDHGNHRLQVLSVEGEYLGVAGPRGYVLPALRPAPDDSDDEQD